MINNRKKMIKEGVSLSIRRKIKAQKGIRKEIKRIKVISHIIY